MCGFCPYDVQHSALSPLALRLAVNVQCFFPSKATGAPVTALSCRILVWVWLRCAC